MEEIWKLLSFSVNVLTYAYAYYTTYCKETFQKKGRKLLIIQHVPDLKSFERDPKKDWAR